MIEVDDNVPMPKSCQELRLELARQIYKDNDVGKSTAAKLAIKELGVWNGISPASAVDYIRQRLPDK